LRKLGLHTAALQSPWVLERVGLAPEVLVQDVRLLHSDGRLTSGSEVYRYVMKRLWWAYPFYLLTLAPGLSHLFNWSYRTFARHRFKISDACRLAPPGQGK
jgi:hypothetical protein